MERIKSSMKKNVDRLRLYQQKAYHLVITLLKQMPYWVLVTWKGSKPES